jgi:hypothetical protein
MVIEITDGFREAFLAQAGYFASLRSLYPDAGSRLERLGQRLTQHVFPLLEANPKMGRLFQFDDGEMAAKLQADQQAIQVELREYVDAHFSILYAVTPDVLYLIDLKHHKQLTYSR